MVEMCCHCGKQHLSFLKMKRYKHRIDKKIIQGTFQRQKESNKGRMEWREGGRKEPQCWIDISSQTIMVPVIRMVMGEISLTLINKGECNCRIKMLWILQTGRRRVSHIGTGAAVCRLTDFFQTFSCYNNLLLIQLDLTKLQIVINKKGTNRRKESVWKFHDQTHHWIQLKKK